MFDQYLRNPPLAKRIIKAPRKKPVARSGKKTGAIKKIVVKRKRYDNILKQEAQTLHNQGWGLARIHDFFQKKLGEKISKTTICTWYSPKNIEKFKSIGKIDINNNETCYSPSQRPPMLIDLERVLLVHILRSQSVGMPMSQMAIRIHA